MHLHDERRLVSRVLRHWQDIGAGRRYPDLRDIDPWLLKDDWDCCFLVQLDSAKGAYFVTVGRALLPAGSPELAKQPVERCPADTILRTVLRHVPQCCEDGCALTLESKGTHLGLSVLFRAVLLPTAEDGLTPNGVFGAVNYRAISTAGEKARPIENESSETPVARIDRGQQRRTGLPS